MFFFSEQRLGFHGTLEQLFWTLLRGLILDTLKVSDLHWPMLVFVEYTKNLKAALSNNTCFLKQRSISLQLSQQRFSPFYFQTFGWAVSLNFETFSGAYGQQICGCSRSCLECIGPNIFNSWRYLISFWASINLFMGVDNLFMIIVCLYSSILFVGKH